MTKQNPELVLTVTDLQEYKGEKMYRKKLKTGTVVSTWSYDEKFCTGISIGIRCDELNNQAIAHFESVKGDNGFENRIIIDKARAEKYGFKIVIQENTEE